MRGWLVSQQVVGVEGPNHGGTIAAAMGEIRDGFQVRVITDGGGRLPRGEGPWGGYDESVKFGFLSKSPGGQGWVREGNNASFARFKVSSAMASD